MDTKELKNILEALLLSSEEPLSINKLQSVFDEWAQPSLESIGLCIDELVHEYSGRSYELIEVATGFKIQTRQRYSHWVSRLQIEKPAKYSRSLLETLAIIAYKQPVTRADIEEIRGVSVNTQTIKTLLEREWIRVAGHKDVPGKPAVYTTTKNFLDYFNLKNLNDLPALEQL